ncbi:MAG TPA: NUDIX hydrolase [Ottowia sp.]|uniref:NUDIX hydrolase n=1 Tax=Ottowia sp. TaxID=1898956 RepID=UPI002B94FC77|nr:NUDIX hydrolase [Ottowia sp.]HMN20610.1 NUDIX hydrolase [Ottowia sp.]
MDRHTEAVEAAPHDAASIVMIRDGNAGLEVLLVRRHAASAVLGGACVFPGGKVDAADASATVLAQLDHTPAELHARLGEAALSPQQAAACFAAAARETFEEAGVLYAHGRPTGTGRPGEAFGALLARLGLTLDTEALTPWSRWITPRQSLRMNRRFDTRFFLAAARADQVARADQHEVSRLFWATPRAALEQYRDRAIDLIPPQLISLAHLARFDGVAAALADARSRAPALIEPEHYQEGDATLLTYPGDVRHSVRQRALPAPTRLYWRDQRFVPEHGFEGFFA